jgi:hypothetical protein
MCHRWSLRGRCGCGAARWCCRACRHRRGRRQGSRILHERLNVLLGLSPWHAVRGISDRVVAWNSIGIGKCNGQAGRDRVALLLWLLLLGYFLVLLLVLLMNRLSRWWQKERRTTTRRCSDSTSSSSSSLLLLRRMTGGGCRCAHHDILSMTMRGRLMMLLHNSMSGSRSKWRSRMGKVHCLLLLRWRRWHRWW